jgi:hypothetical protein
MIIHKTAASSDLRHNLPIPALEEWVLYDGQWVVTEADPQEVDVTIEYYCGECGGILDEKRPTRSGWHAGRSSDLRGSPPQALSGQVVPRLSARPTDRETPRQGMKMLQPEMPFRRGNDAPGMPSQQHTDRLPPGVHGPHHTGAHAIFIPSLSYLISWPHGLAISLRGTTYVHRQPHASDQRSGGL